MNSVSDSLKGVFQSNMHPAAVRVAAIHAATPAEVLQDPSLDLTGAHELLRVPLRFQFQHDSGSYALNLVYLGLVRHFNGIVRIPSSCCMDLLQGKAAQIETQIEGQTKRKQLLRRKQEGPPQILIPLIEALIE
ncbi:MAG: hypothetical protein LLG04_00210, partial [Parachlamydia sp.]|nr:hypothetical protein [Parachlamydia sp.]